MWYRTPDYNSGDQEGTLLYQQMMRNGRRWSPVDAYLRPALGRQNLKVITRALAETIDLEGKRAVGITYRQDGRSLKLRARRDVILSGGAINTPQLLQISGIGETPDMQLYFAPASYGGGGYGTATLDTVPGMTLGASQLRPESTGHVKAVSPDPTAKPEIQPNYGAVQTDRDALLAAMKYLRRLLATPRSPIT